MRRALLVFAGLVAVVGGPLTVSAGPPARPLGLTPEQFAQIRGLEAQPEHAVVLDLHATYKSEREQHLDFNRASDDFWSGVYQVGFPGTVLAILICAAPL